MTLTKVIIASLIIMLINNAKYLYDHLSKTDTDHTKDHRLYLTPYLKNGKIDEGRKLAAVNHEELFNVESYSGYLTVDEQYNSNLFFWYFPSELDPKNDPVVLWLQGGPGSSSLWALFFQNGPFKIHNNRTLSRSRYSYTSNHNVIYIDNPIGSGLSFTDNNRGYAKTESKIYKDLYSGLLQFYQLFPELQGNPLFISGECYAGKYAPALSSVIHQKNPTAKIKINLKGLIIGNAFIDPINQMNFGNHLHEIGMVDLNGKALFNSYEEKIRSLIKSNQLTTAAEVLDELLFNSPSVLSNLTGFQSYLFNYLDNQNPDDWDALVDWIKRPDVRAAIHVSYDTPFVIINRRVYKYLMHEFMNSEADKIAALLPHYKVIFFNGQLDILIPYSSIENVLHNLQWEGRDEFKNAARSIWWSGDELAGYVKKARNLSFVLIRNAGHTSGRHQPKWVLEMTTQFTHN